MAQPTCVEMQNVIAGVSGMNTDSICRPSARRSRNFSVPSADRSRVTICGVRHDEVARQRCAQFARQIGHRGDVGDAAAVEPARRSARARNRGLTARGQRRFERGRSSSARSRRLDSRYRAMSLTVPRIGSILARAVRAAVTARALRLLPSTRRVIVRSLACNSFCVNALRRILRANRVGDRCEPAPCRIHRLSETFSITAFVFSPSG